MLYNTAAGIARITLNPPEKRNALNAEVIAGLRDALARWVRRRRIAGAGKDFCAGLDLMALDRGNDARQFADPLLGDSPPSPRLGGVSRRNR